MMVLSMEKVGVNVREHNVMEVLMGGMSEGKRVCARGEVVEVVLYRNTSHRQPRFLKLAKKLRFAYVII